MNPASVGKGTGLRNLDGLRDTMMPGSARIQWELLSRVEFLQIQRQNCGYQEIAPIPILHPGTDTAVERLKLSFPYLCRPTGQLSSVNRPYRHIRRNRYWRYYRTINLRAMEKLGRLVKNIILPSR